MRIKVLCDPLLVPRTPEGNTSFPTIAEYGLEQLGLLGAAATYEPGMPIYGEGDDDLLVRLGQLPWVKSAASVPAARPKINPAEW